MLTMRSLAALAALFLPLIALAGEPIRIAGSSTLKDTVKVWAVAYAQANPGVEIEVSGDGSGTGFKALSMGQSDLVSSSRPALAYELENLKALKIELNRQVVGQDALSVFVHPANPLQSATLAQLRGIFGEGGTIKKWQDLGITVPGCASGRIELVGRPPISGTYGDFAGQLKAEHGLKLAKAMPSSKDVLKEIAADACAIGYGAYLRADTVRTLCLAAVEGQACVTPEDGIAQRGNYPLMRELYLYSPSTAPEAAQRFLAWTETPEAACLMRKHTVQLPARPANCP